MADEQGGADGATDTGATGGNDQQNDRAKWTPQQWEDFTAREADRRVNEAHKKWRDDLTAQLTAKDKDAETKVQDAITRAQQAEARAAFAERATAEGVGDMKAAWAVAKEYGLVSEKGVVDWKKMKDEHPALFAVTKPQSVAGRVSDTGTANKTNMTALLRNAARK